MNLLFTSRIEYETKIIFGECDARYVKLCRVIEDIAIRKYKRQLHENHFDESSKMVNKIQEHEESVCEMRDALTHALEIIKEIQSAYPEIADERSWTILKLLSRSVVDEISEKESPSPTRILLK
jgi:Mg2+ and Co2+ transporter CorA